MMIKLDSHDAMSIVRRFGFSRLPLAGRGFMLPGESGSLEQHIPNRFRWIGNESELVRLSKRLGILRSANRRRYS